MVCDPIRAIEYKSQFVGQQKAGLEEINGDLLEEDFGTTSSESALDVTSG